MFTVYTKQSNDQIAMFLYLPSSFPGCKLINDFIKFRKSQFIILYTENTQTKQSLCDIVERRSFVILFSLENDLLPEQLVTIKHRNNLKKFSTFFYNCQNLTERRQM